MNAHTAAVLLGELLATELFLCVKARVHSLFIGVSAALWVSTLLGIYRLDYCMHL